LAEICQTTHVRLSGCQFPKNVNHVICIAPLSIIKMYFSLFYLEHIRPDDTCPRRFFPCQSLDSEKFLCSQKFLILYIINNMSLFSHLQKSAQNFLNEWMKAAPAFYHKSRECVKIMCLKFCYPHSNVRGRERRNRCKYKVLLYGQFYGTFSWCGEGDFGQV